MTAQAFYRRTANAIAAYLWQELKIRPGLDYQLRTAISGPRVLTLALLINPRYATKITAMAEPLSMAVGLDREQTIRIGRGHRGTLILETPKPRQLWYNVPLSALPRRSGVRATLGLDTEHRPAWLDFSDPITAHCLVAGATGSGKTNAQRLLFHNLVIQNEPDELAVILIDTRKKGMGWRPFARLPHLAHPVITEEDEARRFLTWATAEIDRRAAAGRVRPRLFIGIDETQALLENEEMVKPISDLAAVGREFEIHLVTATQNPTAAVLGDVSIKRNMVRLVGRVDSGDAARAAAGLGGTGAETLTGAGDMLLVLPGLTRRLTTALLTEGDIERLPRTEKTPRLDLGQYEDIERVSNVVSMGGRRPDPLEAEHVYHALLEPDISLNELYRRFSIGRNKAKSVKAFAGSLLELMEGDGYRITGPERNKTPALAA